MGLRFRRPWAKRSISVAPGLSLSMGKSRRSDATDPNKPTSLPAKIAAWTIGLTIGAIVLARWLG